MPWQIVLRLNRTVMSSLPPIGGIILCLAFTVRAAPIVTLADGRFAAQLRFDDRIAASESFANGNPLTLLPEGDPDPRSLSCHFMVGCRALAVAKTQPAA
jgi:hypothetical protein